MKTNGDAQDWRTTLVPLGSKIQQAMYGLETSSLQIMLSASPRAQLAIDVQDLSGAIVHPGTSIATGTIVNSCVVIGFDLHVRVCSHATPGAVVYGDMLTIEHAHVGARATIRRSEHVEGPCLNCIGAAVAIDREAAPFVAGVPALPL